MSCVKLHPTSSCYRMTPTSTTLTPPSCPPSNSQTLTVYSSSKPKFLLKTKRIPLSVSHCSTKPDTNSINNETDNGDHTSAQPPKPIAEKHHSPPPPPSSSSSSSNLVRSRGLVLDLGNVDSWDSAEIGSPVVKRFLSDEEERWYMWYHGRNHDTSVSDCIGLAVSNNGIHWERGEGPVKSSEDAGLVMSCSQDWWCFDTLSIRPCEILVMSSSKIRGPGAVYWMYYTGYTSEELKYVGMDDNSLEFKVKNPERNGEKGEIYRSLPGLAMSQDGRHWARIEGEHHSGALFDVGSENEWDSLFVASPKVVSHGKGDLRMYYHSFDSENGEFCIGIARSRDGMKWVKLGKVVGGGRRGCFDEYGVVNAHVVRDMRDGKYVMVYEGVGGGGRRGIGMAVSEDGLKGWRRCGEEAILEGGSAGGDGWDSGGVGCPYLVQLGDGSDTEWRLYYNGVNGGGGRSGIGLAVCQGSDLGKGVFVRWTGFSV